MNYDEAQLEQTAPTLDSELTLPCGTILCNRFAKAAMSEQMATRSGAPTEKLTALYRRWSQGGAGLLITGNVLVDRRQPVEPYNVVIENERHLDSLARWAQAARAGGADVWMQLNHPGRQVPRTTSARPVAPSPIPLRLVRGVFARPRALEAREIEDLIARFGRAAGIAQRAGFTGVQIHAAHGYLVSQFLSPRTNRRTDDWGGSLAGRMHFLLELVRAVRESVSPGFAVGVKLNSADFLRGGFTEEESMEVVRALNDERIDLLEVTGGTFEAPAMWGYGPKRASTLEREAHFAAYAECVRDVAQMPIMLSGGLCTPETMARVVRDRIADVVGLARALALVPDLPHLAIAGAEVPPVGGPRRTGLRLVDAALEGLWHNHQLRRLAAGHEPDPRRGLVRTALRAGWMNFSWPIGLSR